MTGIEQNVSGGPIERVLAQLTLVRREREGQWQARCPAHDDRTPSLSVGIGRDGKVLLDCKAGCTYDAVKRAAGLTDADLFPEQIGRESTPSGAAARGNGKRSVRVYATAQEAAQSFAEWKKGTVEAVYEWSADWRRVRVRLAKGKTFGEITRNGDGWILRGPRKPHALYRVGELPGVGTLYVAEGEKACDAGWSIGLPCVTSGCDKSANSADWTLLGGRSVAILPDHDQPGMKYARAVAQKLLALNPPAAVKIVQLPGLDDGGDLHDFVHEHRDSHDADDIRAEIEALAKAATPATLEPGRPNFNLTDLGNAERLVHEHGEDLRYTDSHGWLVWTGSHWEVDTRDAVRRFAKATVRGMYADASRLEDANERRRLATFALRCEAKRAVEAMVDLAKPEPAVRIQAEDLDTDPWLLNVLNGTLDLRTGELRRHDRADLITRRCPVEYRPGARAPRWDAFLSEIMDGDNEMIGFLQRAIGHSLTGDTSERCLFLLYGGGLNGKSTLLHIVREMLGAYAMHARAETVLTRKGNNIRCDLARLKGARFVTITELEEGRRLNVAQTKELVGGTDLITARFLHKNEFSFRPELKPWIATNHKPVIPDATDSIWDRLYAVPFEVRIPEDRVDKELPAKLLAELPGVLRWAMEGCAAWQAAGGLEPPEKVRAAKGKYRVEMDTLAQWLDERCIVGLDTLQARGGDLWKDYKAWCDDSNLRPMSTRKLSERLTEHFRKETAGGGYRTYFGIGLRAEQ